MPLKNRVKIMAYTTIKMVSVLLLYVMGMVGILMSEAIKVLVLRPKSLKIKSLISLNLLLLKSLQVKKMQ